MPNNDGGDDSRNRSTTLVLPKINSILTIVALGVGLFLNMTFGIWNLSQLYYRVANAETKIQILEGQQAADEKTASVAIVEAAKVGAKIDNMTYLIDRLLDQKEGRDGIPKMDHK